MKKLFFILFFAFVAIFSYSQKYDSPYAYINIPLINSISSQLQSDKNGNIYIQLNYFNHSIYKIKNIYLKNENNEIITLKCHHTYRYEYGIDITSTGMPYTKYWKFSYFKLNNDIINKLISSNIIKLRIEYSDDIIDIEYNEKINFAIYLEKLNNKYKEINNKHNYKNQLLNNPLKGF